jgi:hypothetical protein
MVSFFCEKCANGIFARNSLLVLIGNTAVATTPNSPICSVLHLKSPLAPHVQVVYFVICMDLN